VRIEAVGPIRRDAQVGLSACRAIREGLRRGNSFVLWHVQRQTGHPNQVQFSCFLTTISCYGIRDGNTSDTLSDLIPVAP
jgi:hypothetical protein